MKIYDEQCPWPYHQPYGMVKATPTKKPRKPRKSRALPEWLKEQRKQERSALKRNPPRSSVTDEIDLIDIAEGGDGIVYNV